MRESPRDEWIARAGLGKLCGWLWACDLVDGLVGVGTNYCVKVRFFQN